MADNSELMTDLKPCPFCGSDKIAVSHTNLGYEVLCYYYGSGCKSRTGIWPTRIEAIEAWNRRTPVMAEAGAVSEAEVSAAADALQLAFEPGGKDVPYEVAARAALLAARRCARCWEGRTMADVKKLAIDLLASLDPEDLNPEQFNAWSALSAELPTVTAEAGEVSEAEVAAATKAWGKAADDAGTEIVHSSEWMRAALLATRRAQDAPSPMNKEQLTETLTKLVDDAIWEGRTNWDSYYGHDNSFHIQSLTPKIEEIVTSIMKSGEDGRFEEITK